MGTHCIDHDRMDIDRDSRGGHQGTRFERVLKLSVLVWFSLVLVLDAEFSSTSTADAEYEYEKPWNNN